MVLLDKQYDRTNTKFGQRIQVVDLSGMPKSRHEEELEASGASSAFSKDAAWNVESWRKFGYIWNLLKNGICFSR